MEPAAGTLIRQLPLSLLPPLDVDPLPSVIEDEAAAGAAVVSEAPPSSPESSPLFPDEPAAPPSLEDDDELPVSPLPDLPSGKHPLLASQHIHVIMPSEFGAGSCTQFSFPSMQPMILPGQQKQPALRKVVLEQATAPGPAMSSDCGWQDSHCRSTRVVLEAWTRLVRERRKVSMMVRSIGVLEGAILGLLV
jgi:hypothetical protein